MTATTTQPPNGKVVPVSSAKTPINGVKLLRRDNFDFTEMEMQTGIIGTSPQIEKIQKAMIQLAKTSIDVLVTGEPGTGKELVANGIHNLAHKNDPAEAEKKLIVINCPALPESLVESELFGYTPGSFTGSLRQGKRGKLAQAEGGTAFLDEIGDLGLQTQAKLLRFLQEREITIIGGHKPERIEVRVIAATNNNLEKAVSAGKFRGDLFDRFNSYTLSVPPLREHPEDIPRLVWHFIDRHNRRHDKKVRTLDSAVLDLLFDKEYKGNVRELQHCIANAVEMEVAEALTENRQDDPITLGLKYVSQFNFRSQYKEDLEGASLSNLPLIEQDDSSLSHLSPHEQNDVKMIISALKRTGGNILAAARITGFGRQTIYNKLERAKLYFPKKKRAGIQAMIETSQNGG